MTWLDYPITWFIGLHVAIIATLVIGFYLEATAYKKTSGPHSVDGRNEPENTTNLTGETDR